VGNVLERIMLCPSGLSLDRNQSHSSDFVLSDFCPLPASMQLHMKNAIFLSMTCKTPKLAKNIRK